MESATKELLIPMASVLTSFPSTTTVPAQADLTALLTPGPQATRSMELALAPIIMTQILTALLPPAIPKLLTTGLPLELG
jgi:hypothetical protein